MENAIIEKRTSKGELPRISEQDEDREMHECLARLKVWQAENLMAPHGMDRFAVRPE